ncbi:MAG: hypothetical protein IJZ20_08725 [Clostridia bacterium]|nr:hypothetical protein [Clostridia bacterium]
MKKSLFLLIVLCVLLCSCAKTDSIDERIVGKWIDTETEQIVEYTESGYYYEYINENFTTDKTKFITKNDKIYYFLDGDEPDMKTGIDYEIKDGHLFVAGVIEYRPMDLKTSTEEME